MSCTNRPFKYNIPGRNIYVWTYSMKTHYTGNHEGAKMSQDVKNEVFLKLHERTHVNRLVRTYIQGPSIKTVCHTLMGKRRCKIHMCGRVCIELLVGVWGERNLFSSSEKFSLMCLPSFPFSWLFRVVPPFFGPVATVDPYSSSLITVTRRGLERGKILPAKKNSTRKKNTVTVLVNTFRSLKENLQRHRVVTPNPYL